MIDVQGLVKDFGKQHVLKQLSLKVGEGERLALVGQNGSGKTTLIRCLLGLYECEGNLRVFGKDPRKLRQEVLAEVGFVPQQAPGIRASVSEFLLATTRLCGITREPIEEVAAHLGLSLPDISNKAFHALSGGMKQKLLISIALARKPRLLIMDEPAANLDPLARAAFFEELEKLDPSTTILLSSHRIDEISGLVTRLIELDSGKLVLDDLVSVDRTNLGTQMQCALRFRTISPNITTTLNEWGLQAAHDNPCHWSGQIAASDQFRFVCEIARWSGLVQEFGLEEIPNV